MEEWSVPTFGSAAAAGFAAALGGAGASLAGSRRPRACNYPLQAVLALADVADHVRWDGEMRHLPSAGAVLAPPESHPYLVVKQDNNGTTFVISDIDVAGLTGVIAHAAQEIRRPIGGCTHPTSHDIPALPLIGATAVRARPDAEPPF